MYLQLDSWPQPVLAHELSHVIAGNTAPAPFHVSGKLGGIVPDASLIEGLAVALAWEPREGMTPHQWARTLLELHRLPSLKDLVGLGFMLSPARQAYTASGSFVRFLLDTRGAAVVRRAYRTDDVVTATGESLPVLETQWHAFLRTVPLPPDALALARARFTPRSIFSTVCPHRLADLRDELSADLGAGDEHRARMTCWRILDINPTDPGARASLVGALASGGDARAARAQLATLESPKVDAPPPFVAAARQALANAYWRRGQNDQALAIYRQLLHAPEFENAARALEVETLGLEAGGRQGELLFDLLVGPEGQGASPPMAVRIAYELSRIRADGLGPYLEGRQLWNDARYAMALPLLREAGGRGLPTPRLSHENDRLLGVSLYATRRLDDAYVLWTRVSKDPTETEARRDSARQWLRRIAWSRHHH